MGGRGESLPVRADASGRALGDRHATPPPSLFTDPPRDLANSSMGIPEADVNGPRDRSRHGGALIVGNATRGSAPHA